MLSVSQSAQILGVSDARVRALISSGNLAASKIGRAWMLREEDVMQRLASRPTGGRPRLDDAGPNAATETANPEGDHGSNPDLGRLYRECREAFRVRPSAEDISKAGSQEEAAFYMEVSDFFLRRRQAELVKAGVY